MSKHFSLSVHLCEGKFFMYMCMLDAGKYDTFLSVFNVCGGHFKWLHKKNLGLETIPYQQPCSLGAAVLA